MSKKIGLDEVVAYIDSETTSRECLALLVPIAKRLGWRCGFEKDRPKLRGLVLGNKEFMDEHWPDDGEKSCYGHPGTEN